MSVDLGKASEVFRVLNEENYMTLKKHIEEAEGLIGAYDTRDQNTQRLLLELMAKILDELYAYRGNELWTS